MSCVNCGAEFLVPGNFCSLCGAANNILCPACSHPNRASARYCVECGTTLYNLTAISPPGTQPPSPRGERRRITVMFCDLIGSTSLAVRLDPEDLSEVMRSYRSLVATTVGRFGGSIAQYLGDGVLVYFGWPRAYETDSEQAVRAGLAVTAAVGKIVSGGGTLRVRVGIASGLVVVGDIAGDGNTQEPTAMGQAPNLAARVMGIALPDTVVIANETRLQIGDLFDCEDLGMTEIRGFADPVRLWRVNGESMVQSRFEALHPSELAPIIGRDEEIELLLRRWKQVTVGEGRVVLISGEPGIGKSRLLAALQERLRGEAHATARYFCLPDHQDNALHPITGHLEYVAGFARNDTAERKAQKLRAALAAAVSSEQDIALIADLLSLRADGIATLTLSPQRRKERTFAALRRMLEVTARQAPVLMVFEDLHWSDPTTLEYMDLMINWIQRLPVLLVATCRPEFRARWVGRARVASIMLSRLDHLDAAALVAQLIGAKSVRHGLIEQIVAESDGIPLFIEELTKAVLEGTVSPAQGGAIPYAHVGVPSTLQSSLMARLDRHPAAREIAQIGAVIGREFSHSLLSAVATRSDADLRHAVDSLVGSELVTSRGTGPDTVYTFKHALIQETAYGSLLRRRRKLLHERVAAALVALSPEMEETNPALIAHHCAHAGLIERAASYYRRAGERSAERAAMAETHAQIERGLALVATLPESDARRTLEVELKLALGRVLLSTRASSDTGAGKAFEEAVVLCRGFDHTELYTRALWGYWFNHAHRHMLSATENAAEELLAFGQRQSNDPARFVAHGMWGITRFWQGRFGEARSHLEDAREFSQRSGPTRLDLAIVADNLDSHLSAQYALTLACLGHLDQAAAETKLASEAASRLAHMPSRAIVIAVKARYDWFVRDETTLRLTAASLIELSEEQGFPFYMALGRCHLGWLAVKDGNIRDGLNQLNTGLAGLRAIDAVVWEPSCFGMMADALVWAGDLVAADRLLDEALVISADTGGAWFDAELHRSKGEVAMMHAKPDAELAERFFRQAIAIARDQSARLWELRAATCLARLLGTRNETNQACALLSPLLDWFKDQAHVPDVNDGLALHESLLSTMDRRPARRFNQTTQRQESDPAS
jgi:class 3 adenylate cyclase